MLIVPLILAATAGLAEDPAPAAAGVQVATAEVRATILRPAIVRQADGFQPIGEDAPKPQITRHGDRLLIEFE